MSNIKEKAKEVISIGSKENANKNSELISTKKELCAGFMSEDLVEEMYPEDILAEHKSGGIHIHDIGDRAYKSINCCLFDMGRVLDGGFELSGIKYTEPTSVESCMRVIGDIILHASSQQYGGFTVPEIDTVLAKYVRIGLEKSEAFYRRQLEGLPISDLGFKNLASGYVTRSLEQGFQAIETRQNSVNNGNGQTTFLTFTFGLDTTPEGRLVSKILLENRKAGIGRDGATPIFPKLVFLHRYGINGQEGDPNYDIYLQAIDTSSVRMYPDYLSLNAGYLGEMFDKYGKAVSPMGCRAFLSPWYNENGEPVFIGRANCGAITINTVRCAIEAKGDKAKFFSLLHKRFDMATRLHLLTYDLLKDVKASSNPLFFTQGGCHIKLDPEDTIQKAIDTFTWSYGYIGLQEATLLMTGKNLHEDNSFAIEVLKELQRLIEEAKEKHGLLFALYSTPSEGLCHTFRNKDFKKFGVIEGVTDKEYYMNSFHVDVKAHVSALEKQKIETPMFDIATGGRIIYNEFPNRKNTTAMKQMVDVAMKTGKYYGINMQLDQCNQCGHDGEFTDKICTNCGSDDIISVNRVCGYLSYDHRLNDGKKQEKDNRVDHFEIEL